MPYGGWRASIPLIDTSVFGGISNASLYGPVSSLAEVLIQ
jgi:hypothetical protein